MQDQLGSDRWDHHPAVGLADISAVDVQFRMGSWSVGGVSMIISAITGIMLSLAVRKAAAKVSSGLASSLVGRRRVERKTIS